MKVEYEANHVLRIDLQSHAVSFVGHHLRCFRRVQQSCFFTSWFLKNFILSLPLASSSKYNNRSNFLRSLSRLFTGPSSLSSLRSRLRSQAREVVDWRHEFGEHHFMSSTFSWTGGAHGFCWILLDLLGQKDQNKTTTRGPSSSTSFSPLLLGRPVGPITIQSS